MPRNPTQTARLDACPADHPIGVVWSAAPGPDAGVRLARPSGLWTWRPATGWRSALGESPQIAQAPAPGEDPLAAIDRLWSSTRQPDSSGAWLVTFSYDLGRRLEERAQHPNRAPDDRDHPDIILARVDGLEPAPHSAPPARSYVLESPNLSASRGAYQDAVRQALHRIRAGDVYQVNLTHRLSGAFRGSSRALASDLLAGARPWHGLYLELDEPSARRALLCASPELFLDADLNTGLVRTRPMKGTRPAEGDPDELRDAPKDRAELDMITDLMRNDLGRVCAFGSVRVETPRAIERHDSGVLQATSSVVGRLRPGVGLDALLRATFPPGSVTGAPKVRAMQLIDELEQHRRGPYCGACGVLTDSGRLTLGVSIRTAIITGRAGANGLDDFAQGVLDFPVGAGIVSDSDPVAEWDETLVKARALNACTRRPPQPQAQRCGA